MNECRKSERPSLDSTETVEKSQCRDTPSLPCSAGGVSVVPDFVGKTPAFGSEAQARRVVFLKLEGDEPPPGRTLWAAPSGRRLPYVPMSINSNGRSHLYRKLLFVLNSLVL
jgi:hypothetical protein